jgi:hypothetical protein
MARDRQAAVLQPRIFLRPSPPAAVPRRHHLWIRPRGTGMVRGSPTLPLLYRPAAVLRRHRANPGVRYQRRSTLRRGTARSRPSSTGAVEPPTLGRVRRHASGATSLWAFRLRRGGRRRRASAHEYPLSSSFGRTFVTHQSVFLHARLLSLTIRANSHPGCVAHLASGKLPLSMWDIERRKGEVSAHGLLFPGRKTEIAA